MSDILDFKPNYNPNKITNCWCDVENCIYQQNKCCMAGPELKHNTHFTNNKKPVLICNAFISR